MGASSHSILAFVAGLAAQRADRARAASLGATI
jgi:hypothetical protein